VKGARLRKQWFRCTNSINECHAERAVARSANASRSTLRFALPINHKVLRLRWPIREQIGQLRSGGQLQAADLFPLIRVY
jgi:hypothetical protein